MKGFYDKIVEVLQEHGCWFVRYGKGDHEIWHSPHTDKNFPVDGVCRSRHTANEIMKQAGIDHKFR
jgi:predicted RNA binding protein YcfA (HicA-like mRNA interferase family)